MRGAEPAANGFLRFVVAIMFRASCGSIRPSMASRLDVAPDLPRSLILSCHASPSQQQNTNLFVQTLTAGLRKNWMAAFGGHIYDLPHKVAWARHFGGTQISATASSVAKERHMISTETTQPGHDAESPSIQSFKVFITSHEAYPAFEQLFLNAQHEVWASFRVFDPRTKLRSDKARAIGETWFDLFAHTLKRGVNINLTLADFDPIAATDLHLRSWYSMRQLFALTELETKGSLQTTAAMHPARAGMLPRVIGHAMLWRRLTARIGQINAMPADKRLRQLQHLPGLHAYRSSDSARLRRCWHLPDLHPATHHQKLAVFDRKTLYIGGLDLDERRYDTPEHRRPANQTWHDVQCVIEGPVVDAAQTHLESFLDVTANRRSPAPKMPGFIRTISAQRYASGTVISPATKVNEIEAAHFEATRKAEHLIYLETQFFRDQKFAQALAQRARTCSTLRLIVLLPAAPDDVAFEGSQSSDARYGEYLQSRCIKILRRAFGDRMLVVSPVTPGNSDSNERDALIGAPIIYVHSKVSIFDNQVGIVSSANLNGRSLRWDTEAGVHLTQSPQIAHLRRRVMGAWLPKVHADADTDTQTAFENWRNLAIGNAALPPEKRRGFIVPYDPKPAERMGKPAPGVPEETV